MTATEWANTHLLHPRYKTLHHTTSTKKRRWSSRSKETLDGLLSSIGRPRHPGEAREPALLPDGVAATSQRSNGVLRTLVAVAAVLSHALAHSLSLSLSCSVPSRVSSNNVRFSDCPLGRDVWPRRFGCPSIQASSKYLGGATCTQDTHNLDSYVLTGLLLAPITHWWISAKQGTLLQGNM